MSKVTELKDDNFRESIQSNSLVLVDFYADWCGPCRLFAPIYASVAEKHPNITFFKIDGDLNPAARSDFDIDNLPFVAAYKDGKFIEGFSTTVEAGLENFIARMTDEMGNSK